MSDRGRNRRPARSSKATPPQAASDEQVEAEEPTSAAASPAETPAETPADASAEAAGEVPAEDEAPVEETAEPDDSVDSDSEESDESDESEKSDKGKKARGPAPLTKAEKRAAARIAAAKAARRRRVGGAIAGSLIVLLALGGALAGVWYFGDRAEKQKTECKPPTGEQSYPPLLGGFDKKLADEPKVEPGKEAKLGARDVQVVIKGNCKTVKPGDTVVVNYIGATYKDGKVFDSSWQRKQTFPVQVGMLEQHQQPQVIEGWDRGLVGLKVGSRVVLDVPGKEAYEANGPAPQGYPQGDLRFYVDILDIQAPDAGGGLNGGLGGN